MSKQRNTENGQAVVEFAVILPVLLMILFAILQFGIVFNNYIQVTAAAREGARKAAVSRSLGTSAAETAATASAKGAAPGLKQTSIQVTRIANCGHNPDSPTPRSMAARNASFVAVNGSALMNGCTTRGKFSEEKNTPDSTHMGSIVRFI